MQSSCIHQIITIMTVTPHPHTRLHPLKITLPSIPICAVDVRIAK